MVLLLFTAQFLADTGRLQESADIYRAAINTAPDDFELIFNAANALRWVVVQLLE